VAIGSIQYQCANTVRISGSEQQRHRPALRDAEEGRFARADCIHDRADIVHAFVECWYTTGSVGQARATLVEHD
jgi:hypothetical protein